MKRPLLLPLLSASVAMALLSLTGCKTSPADEKKGAETDKDRSKRSAAEIAFYQQCGELGEKGGNVDGKDGWLFGSPELLQLSRISSTSAATSAIADYAQQLRARNIELILVPVPPKALVYPDKISRKVPVKSKRPPRLDSLLKTAMDELAAKKVKVVDLLPAFLAHREDKDGPVFPRTSGTWSPHGVRIATKEIADAVRESKGGKGGTVTGITAEPATLNFTGALAIITEDKVKPEIFHTQRIGRIVGDKVKSLSFETSGGSILLMGDSSIVAWREANNPQGSNGAFCSLAEQLAAELQTIPDVLATLNDGRNTPRLRILRERTNGHGMLEGTRVVVWVIPGLDLTVPNWQKVPLQLEFSEGSQDLKLRQPGQAPAPASAPAPIPAPIPLPGE